MKKMEITKLDKLWREAIKERDTFCQLCGNNHLKPNAHHIIGRRNRNVRWELDNGILLCPGCHTFGIKSAHQDPLFFMDWFKSEYPERYNNIHEMSNYTGIKQLFPDIEQRLKNHAKGY